VTPSDSRPALDPSLTIAGGRDLIALVGRLCRERAWETLTSLFASLGDGGIAPAALGDLDGAARLVEDALSALPPPKNPRGPQADELRALCLAIAEALLARCARPPLVELERRTLTRAAGLLERGGDHRRAALAYEDLGADERAADAWGALGDLERMEAAHAREANKAARERAAGELLRRFEALLTGGERMRALATIASVSGIAEAASLGQRAAMLERRLCRGRAVTLRAPGAAPVRIAPLPAEIGRDPLLGIPLRDPAVSRRHALLRAEGNDIVLEDLGSRAGIHLGGVRLESGAALPLRGRGEIALGPATVLRFEAAAGQVVLQGERGLDRGLRALAGAAPLAFDDLLPGTSGLAIEIAHELVRLVRRPDVAARVDGHLIGPGCDLLHGDVVEVIEAMGAAARFEVE
jgi:hypothetical protein